MEIDILKDKIAEYRKKFYLNKLLQGGLFFIMVTASLITLIGVLEYFFWFGSSIRAVIFYLSLLILIYAISYWLIIPYLKYLRWIKDDLTDDQLAAEIGNSFPEVKDKLVNALQIQQVNAQDNSLILASINDYIGKLSPIPFAQSIDLKVNLKYAKHIGFIMLSILLISWFYPDLYKESTKRLVSYQTHYSKPAPFTFQINENELVGYRNEPLTISASIEGEAIPNSVFLVLDERSVNMNKTEKNKFVYTIQNLTKAQTFTLSGGGFDSKPYSINVYDRANLTNLSIDLDYPNYTGIADEKLSNVGSLNIPEGTTVTWNMTTRSVDKALIIINDSLTIEAQGTDNQKYTSNYKFLGSGSYEIKLMNEYTSNKEKLKYQVAVLKDEYPTVEASFYLDTLLYEYVLVSGKVGDDYGVSGLAIISNSNNKRLKSTININKGQVAQDFFYKYELEKSLDQNEQITLYVSVRDNDAINNYKESRSNVFTIRLPKQAAINSALAEKSNESAKNLEKSIKEASSINEKIKQLQERLLSKQGLEWQEEKMLNELLEQRKKMEEAMKELQNQFDELNDAEDKFNDRSDDIKEKAAQLQKLMEEVLDSETKKLYEELQKLMEENGSLDDIRDQLNELSPNEQSMEKELERALELFKRLKVEAELEKTSNKLEELAKEQEELANDTKSQKNTSNQEEKESLVEQQEKINDSFDELQEKMKQIEQMNQELKNPEPLTDYKEEMEKLNEGLDKASEELKQDNLEQGENQQRKNSQQMRQLSQQMKEMMAGMQMEMMTENIDNLRNILDNLVKLSFEQERLIDGFYEVTQVDPQFVVLSQSQLKLKDDAVILEDSLMALAERVVQISSFITREVGDMNYNIEEALSNLRDRDRNKALSNQQFAMASINNLALLLDDLLQQMQNNMASSMGKGKPQDKKGEGMPNLQQLQKQLSQQIQEMKDSGVKGRKLSEQLAKMAAQQEMLREKMNELKQSLNGQSGGEKAGDAMEKAMKLMEENESDLVNKRVTQELINRQEKIMTRMLDAENAMQEQELDKEREAQAADEIDRKIPKAFQEYLLERKKQIELQKTVPVGLNPFYKKEVNDYFRRLSTDN